MNGTHPAMHSGLPQSGPLQLVHQPRLRPEPGRSRQVYWQWRHCRRSASSSFPQSSVAQNAPSGRGTVSLGSKTIVNYSTHSNVTFIAGVALAWTALAPIPLSVVVLVTSSRPGAYTKRARERWLMPSSSSSRFAV